MRLITAVNEAYLPGLIALNNSIKANSPNTELICYVFGSAMLHKVIHLGIKAIDLKELDAPPTGLPITKAWPVASGEMYCRLIIPRRSTVKKVAWIDADCIVLKPLDELDNIVFNEPVAAVRTSTVTVGQQVGGLPIGNHSPALFAGLLLFNIPEWNRLRITEKCFEAMKEPLDFKYVVQSVLSYVLQGNFHELPYEWQVFANRTTTDQAMIDRAKILHYVGDLPWKNKMRNQEIWERYSNG